MDKRIVNTYVKKVATKDLDELVNVLYIALNGNPDQSKALMLSVLLEEPNENNRWDSRILCAIRFK